MLFKWIVCHVQEDMKDSFSRAQTQWTALARTRGFVGQLGGWDLNSKNDACILAIWDSPETFQTFMDENHDAITADNDQAETYETIDVALLRPICDMPGSYANMPQCLEKAKIIRVADCLVNMKRQKHFIDVQREVWIPGMSKATGMLAGSFNRGISDQSRYVVTTLWESLRAHESYAQNILPLLQAAATVSQDLEKIVGRLIDLNADWLVLPPTE